MKSFSSSIRRSQRILLALLATSAVFTAGCANMATTAGGSGIQGETATIGGTIHGGVQPVAFATVQLWFAGQGAGSPALVVAQTTSLNNGAGSFSFVKGADGGANAGTGGNTWSCPGGSSNPLVYVVASGGNTQNNGDSTRNTASVFVAPYGLCNSITSTSFVNLTEVTTVATMAVWQQYFNPSVPAASATIPIAGSFDSDGTGLALESMINSYTLLANLVNVATGTAYTTKNIPASTGAGIVGVTGTSVTATPEAAKLNTMANILAACINTATFSASGSTPCNTIFSNATPPDPTTTSSPASTFTNPPVDVLHAVYYMLTNPTNGSTTKLGNLYALSPATGAAFTPTLGAVPTDWTIGITYATANTCGGGASPGHLINSVQDLAIDQYGGVWLANNEAGGNVALLSNNGAPEGCIKIGSGLNTGITLDGLSGGLQNVWIADSGSSNVYKYGPGGSSAIAFPTAAAPVSITADGANNIYYTSNSNLYALPSGASLSAVTPVTIGTAVGSGSRVLVDSSPAIWNTSGATSIYRTACTALTTATCSSTSTTTVGPTYGIGVSPLISVTTPSPHQQNSVYFSAGTGSNSVSLFQGTPGSSYTSVTGWPVIGATAGLSNPAAVAVDGAQNVWAINNFSGANSVVEIGAAKQLLSGTTGFVKDVTYLGSGRSVVIDSSGNVWIGRDGANSITEIVGAAVPVSQPYALALRNGTFQKIP